MIQIYEVAPIESLRVLRDARCNRLVQRNGDVLIESIYRDGNYDPAYLPAVRQAIALGHIELGNEDDGRDHLWVITDEGNVAYSQIRNGLLGR